jgi:hypothetical protein
VLTVKTEGWRSDGPNDSKKGRLAVVWAGQADSKMLTVKREAWRSDGQADGQKGGRLVVLWVG